MSKPSEGNKPTSTPAAENRRRLDRYSVELEISLESEHNFYTGFTHNLSSGGLFVQTQDLKPIGTRLRIKFTLPDLELPVETDVVVRWVCEVGDPYKRGMGVQFLKLPGYAHQAIEQFIHHREALFFDHDD